MPGSSSTGGAAAKLWGSIYSSPTTNAFGYSSPHSTPQAAEMAAYRSCAARGPGCEERLTHSNTCAAFAMSPRGATAARARTSLEEAKSTALLECNKVASTPCVIVRTQCTGSPAPGTMASGGSQWGAIYYSRSTRATGASWQTANAERADAVALQQCATRANDCQKGITFDNDCGAVAASPNGFWGSGTGIVQAAADSTALRLCKQNAKVDCTIVRRGCSAPGM